MRPTLVADVNPAHRLAQEEIFGPVQALIPFDDEADAFRNINTAEELAAATPTRA